MPGKRRREMNSHPGRKKLCNKNAFLVYLLISYLFFSEMQHQIGMVRAVSYSPLAQPYTIRVTMDGAMR
jgi:hypothetical protein